MTPITLFNFNENTASSNVSTTYKIETQKNQIKGFIDETEAIKQAIYKILLTEKNVFQIYNENYGVSLADLFGKNIYFVQSEIPLRIQKALLNDDRILKVYDFSFFNQTEKGSLLVKFFVSTIFGDNEFSLEVNI
ncbi:MAG: DUF2634 domain-containing protein [Clostridia bacterium]|nr:DUF2634 domain-containing protein [Clostridia bacterium]